MAGARPVLNGAAEIWLDSMDAVVELFSEPKFAELVFLDHEQTVMLVRNEHLVCERQSS